jgi:hypothetical protein
MAFHRRVLIHVDNTGKTDAEVAAEVAAQLTRAGVQKPSVSYERSGDRGHLEFEALDHDGQAITIGWFHPSPVLHLPLVATSRDPGMTDAQLMAKIERQIREDGLDVGRKLVININGDDVQVLLEPAKDDNSNR